MHLINVVPFIAEIVLQSLSGQLCHIIYEWIDQAAAHHEVDQKSNNYRLVITFKKLLKIMLNKEGNVAVKCQHIYRMNGCSNIVIASCIPSPSKVNQISDNFALKHFDFFGLVKSIHQGFRTSFVYVWQHV